MYLWRVTANQYQTDDLSLRIEVVESTQNIKMIFYGKSKARSPEDFLNAIILEVINKARPEQKDIILDFYNLEFINSATVAPIIKLWAKLKSAGIRLIIEYNGNLKWQKTSFMAFSVFEKESELFKLHAR